MPIYEYEPVDRDCLICEGRIEVLQGMNDKAYELCPFCGLAIKRLISKASVQISKKVNPDQAAKKGFSTFRKAQKGVWEKVAGPDNPESKTGDLPEDDGTEDLGGGKLKI